MIPSVHAFSDALYAIAMALIGVADSQALARLIPETLERALSLSEAILYTADDARATAYAGPAPSRQPEAGQAVVPLMYEGQPWGVLLLRGSDAVPPALLQQAVELVAVAVARAASTQDELGQQRQRAQEMDTLAQIDRELSDSIDLNSVFEFTLDWALRYTLAHGAYLTLYDEEKAILRPVASLGYETPPETIAGLFENGGIPQRVAATNRLENVPDVIIDSGHLPVAIAMRSHLSVPITREDRVIAVMSLEGKRINMFTDAHVNFIIKLCARAGIAIDNARLYADAVREREQTASILREISDVVIVVGKDGRIILLNPAAINLFHLNPHERYVGMRIEPVFQDEQFVKHYHKAVESGTALMSQMPFSDDRVFAATFAPTPEIGWIITLHDLTELRRADASKRDFISVLSHDLKQPIGVVKGYVELLEMQLPDMTPRMKRYMDMIYSALQNMMKLIEDMLELARLDAGLALNLEDVMPAHLVNSAYMWIRPAAEAKSMELEMQVAERLPLVRGDENRLTQVLVNLLHNAVKYTPRGGKVVVSAEKQGASVRFSVRDNGIGISPDDQKAIFNRFFRVRRPETENIEGSGVGLALVKKLVDLHHGQIGLESRLGEGTTFFVILPVGDD